MTLADDLRNAQNSFRISQGLDPLTNNAQLASVAQTRANYLAQTQILTHYPSDGNYLYSNLIQASGYSYTVIGENIGYDSDPDGTAVATIETAFENSPDHRSNMVYPYTDVGVGYAKSSDGRQWFAVEFGSQLVPDTNNVHNTPDNENFTPVGALPDVHQIQWQGLPDTYIAATDDGLFKTIDNGETWGPVVPNDTWGTEWPADAIAYQAAFAIGPRECDLSPDVSCFWTIKWNLPNAIDWGTVGIDYDPIVDSKRGRVSELSLTDSDNPVYSFDLSFNGDSGAVIENDMLVLAISSFRADGMVDPPSIDVEDLTFEMIATVKYGTGGRLSVYQALVPAGFDVEAASGSAYFSDILDELPPYQVVRLRDLDLGTFENSRPKQVRVNNGNSAQASVTFNTTNGGRGMVSFISEDNVNNVWPTSANGLAVSDEFTVTDKIYDVQLDEAQDCGDGGGSGGTGWAFSQWEGKYFNRPTDSDVLPANSCLFVILSLSGSHDIAVNIAGDGFTDHLLWSNIIEVSDQGFWARYEVHVLEVGTGGGHWDNQLVNVYSDSSTPDHPYGSFQSSSIGVLVQNSEGPVIYDSEVHEERNFGESNGGEIHLDWDLTGGKAAICSVGIWSEAPAPPEEFIHTYDGSWTVINNRILYWQGILPLAGSTPPFMSTRATTTNTSFEAAYSISSVDWTGTSPIPTITDILVGVVGILAVDS